VLEVRGEVDLSNASEVLGELLAQVPNEAHLVVVDLSATVHLDSSGVAMLFQVAERLRRSRQDVRLVVPREAPIRSVIELTAVSAVIPVDDSLSAVRAAQEADPSR
jgi:anti-anti-sigma factor